jgi:proteasome lid subunit RPN8/RPN11
VPSVRRPRIWLSERAEAQLADAARNAHPQETGGVLVGLYVGRERPWVVEATVLPPHVASHSYYELPAEARPRAVDSARETDERLGYLGDWHSHPEDVGPSGTDITTMKQLAADPAAACPHPVLLIARRTGSGYRLDARELATRKLRRLTVISAGGLPRNTEDGPSRR